MQVSQLLSASQEVQLVTEHSTQAEALVEGTVRPEHEEHSLAAEQLRQLLMAQAVHPEALLRVKLVLHSKQTLVAEQVLHPLTVSLQVNPH